MTGQSYFYAKSINGEVKTRGKNLHFMGHKIDHENGVKPDGIFAEWCWDGNKLIVNNDRYGYFPLYYCCYNREIYLAPSIREILAQGAPNELDYTALSVFLRFGFFIGEDTPFKYIKVLPPNATFVWEKGELSIAGNYAIKNVISISEDDAIDEYIQLFRKSMQKRLHQDETHVVPLSGGRDSRHILLELDHLGCKPQFTITLRPYPPYDNEDIRIAKIISEEVGVKHITLERRNSPFVDELRALEITNYCSDEHAWMLALPDYLKDKTRITYDGIAGDVLSAGTFWENDLSNLYHTRSYPEICKTLLKSWAWMRINDDILKWIVGKDFLNKISLETAIEHMACELKKHIHAPNPVSSFYFWTRTRRKIGLSAYSLYRDFPKVYSPFIDHDLYDFLAALPEDILKGSNFHSKTIERAYPRFAHIPYEQNDTQQISISNHRQQYTKEFARHSFKNNLLSSRVIKGHYILPRALKCLLNDKYAESMWWAKPGVITYLMQLEKLQNYKY